MEVSSISLVPRTSPSYAYSRLFNEVREDTAIMCDFDKFSGYFHTFANECMKPWEQGTFYYFY